MQQPPFWLKVNNHYVIENFEQLLAYVKRYSYEPEQESEESDFCQTFKYLRAVAVDYASQIGEMKLFTTPAFDIPVEKVVRILAASLLTAKKMGRDDYEVLEALVNLLLLANRYMQVDIERRMAVLVKNCICRTPIVKYNISYADLESETFTMGAIETKLSNTVFGLCSESPYIYEHGGCLLVSRNETLLTNVNFYELPKARLRTELKTGEGLVVKTTTGETKHDIDDLLRLYPLIGGEFDKVKPSPRPTEKVYGHGSSFIARVRRVQGVKVEVERADETYQYEKGNVYIDKQIALVPQDDFRALLTIGGYLPVFKNEEADLPYRVDLRWIQQFVEDYANDIVADSDPELQAILVKTEPWGSRWLTECGLHLNVFNNEVAPDLKADLQRAIADDLPVLLRIGPAQTWNVKGIFRGVAADEPVPDPVYFSQQAYATFVEEMQAEAAASLPSRSVHEPAGEITPAQMKLYGMLTYRLAIKRNYANSYERLEGLIAAMLLLRMAGDEADTQFVRSTLDYQKALISFAQGATPSSISLPANSVAPEVEELQEWEQVVDILRGYREQTDTSMVLSTSIGRHKSAGEVAGIVGELVRASNSLLGKIDTMEFNRIKKSICSHLGVDDEYVPLRLTGANYGVESEILEFKASCVYPPAQHRSGTLLADINFQRWTILKTVCAFLNSNTSGDLLIGVSDSGFALGLQADAEILFKERIISEPTADRVRNYVKLFLDQGFATLDGRVKGTAITAGRVECKIEQTDENREILRVKVSPYPGDVVKIIAPDRPARFVESYIRTSGASTPLVSSLMREVKLRKLKALDKGDYKTAKIMQAIDSKLVVEIKNYNSISGRSTRRVEPFMILDAHKGFLAYDLDRKDVRMFRFGRFADSGLRLTDDTWRNERKHEVRDVDIFGNVHTAHSPASPVSVKLTDYARTLLIEECALEAEKGEAHEQLFTMNPDAADRTRFPWLLTVSLNDPADIARFVMGLPDHTRVVDNPELDRYIAECRSQAEAD